MAFHNAMIAEFLAISTYILTLALVRPYSFLRFFIFTLMISYILLALTPSSVSFSHPFYANTFGSGVVYCVLLYLDRILLGQWSSDARGPTSTRGGQQVATPKRDDDNARKGTNVRPIQHASVSEQLWWAAGNTFDTRLATTPWEVVNIPPFSWRDPTWVPTKLEFLSKNAVVSAVCLLLLDSITLLAVPVEQNAITFAEERVGFFTRLGDVSSEEVAIRFVAAGMYWTYVFLLFRAVYSGIAIIMVGLGLGEVKRWPPPFGRCLDAWSIRQFWGSFWHQSMRQTLSSPARFITYSILGFRKGGLLGRYLFIFLTFWLSGALHLCGDLASGLAWYEVGTLRFFYMQSLGIVLEDGVQAAYRAITSGRAERATANEKLGKNQADPSLWKCVIGYVWVAMWMAWSVPVYTYPTARGDKGEGVLPFSLVQRFV